MGNYWFSRTTDDIQTNFKIRAYGNENYIQTVKSACVQKVCDSDDIPMLAFSAN